MNTALPTRNTSLQTRPSGRAVDFITPHLVRGCLVACRTSYCHVNAELGDGLVVAANVEEILQAVHRHICSQPWPRLPNRTDERYYTYDFAAATDLGLHWQATDWARVIRFFSEHPRAKGAFSLKYTREALWTEVPVQSGKVRVRLSVLPEPTRRILEPTAPSIGERLATIPCLLQAGYEVDLNFSPLICYEGWLDDYAALFAQIDHVLPPAHRKGMRYETTLLSHHPRKQGRNLAMARTAAETLLFNPDLQELVGAAEPHRLLRYRYELRRGILRQWTELHDRLLPWNALRFAA